MLEMKEKSGHATGASHRLEADARPQIALRTFVLPTSHQLAALEGQRTSQDEIENTGNQESGPCGIQLASNEAHRSVSATARCH